MKIKINENKPQSFWDNIPWTDETRGERSGNAVHQFVQRQ